MKTSEILSIIALAALGLCLICGLAKMAMKSDKTKKGCDDACSLLVFIAVVVLGISQLLNEDGYKEEGCECCVDKSLCGFPGMCQGKGCGVAGKTIAAGKPCRNYHGQGSFGATCTISG